MAWVALTLPAAGHEGPACSGRVGDPPDQPRYRTRRDGSHSGRSGEALDCTAAMASQNVSALQEGPGGRLRLVPARPHVLAMAEHGVRRRLTDLHERVVTHGDVREVDTLCAAYVEADELLDDIHRDLTVSRSRARP